MFPRTKNRKAISTVLTTMIILVASVVLGTGVVLYGTSLFQTNASGESISTTGTQVWVDSTLSSGWAWGAFDVRNSGDKLLSVDQIQVRGQAVPYASWYADTNQSALTNTQYQSALIYTSMLTAQVGGLKNGTSMGYPAVGECAQSQTNLIIQLTTGLRSLCFTQQSGPVSLAPGAKAIIYFKVPNNLLTSVDAGSASSVAVYAGKVGSPVSVTVAAK
ncbi:MAG: hypothetical protein E6K91_09045 [Thaumarchaeota archaeon]|nr:MAG: hypothetical protein E6K91_09045 [Nitrososphaerota archaeon]